MSRSWSLLFSSFLSLALSLHAGPREKRLIGPGAELPGSGEPARPAVGPEPSGLVRLEDALAAALLGNPELAAFGWEVRAMESRRLQASLRPNPELSIDVENLGGGDQSFSGKQNTYSLGLPFELGGKRATRIRLAQAESALAAWDYESKRIDVLTAVRRAMAAVLGGQRQLDLAGETLSIATRAAQSVGAKVQAGAVSPVEETRSRILLSEATIDFNRAEHQLAAARSALSATWGSSQPRFKSATGELDVTIDLPELEQLRARIHENPDLARWASELEQRRSSLALARSQARPDVTPFLGYRHLTQFDENTLILGVSLPLPTRNRNQGAIREAELRTSKVSSERDAARNRIEAQLAELQQARAEVERLTGEPLGDVKKKEIRR